MAQWKRIQLGTMRLRLRSLASLSGLRIQHCRDLRCRSQMRLGSCVAVALVQVGSYSSDSTTSLGTSTCHGSSPRKGKKPKQNKTHKMHTCTFLTEYKMHDNKFIPF